MQAGTKQNASVRGIGEPIDWAPRLEGILGEQKRLCDRLDELSNAQGERIRSGDTAALLQLLSERDEVVNRLSSLNGELEPYRREWDWCMGRLAPEQRDRMETTVRELGELVDRIWAKDEADKAELERERSAIAAELSGLSRGRVAMNAYGVRAAGTAPLYQDRSC